MFGGARATYRCANKSMLYTHMSMGREYRNQTYHQNVRLQIQIKYDVMLQNTDYTQSIGPHK